jgi:hypothetical protein
MKAKNAPFRILGMYVYILQLLPMRMTCRGKSSLPQYAMIALKIFAKCHKARWSTDAKLPGALSNPVTLICHTGISGIFA